MTYTVDTVSKGKYFAQIVPDEDPGETPRDWDNLGTMVCFHRNYNLGDIITHKGSNRTESGKDENTFSSPEQFKEWLNAYGEDEDRFKLNPEIVIILPLYLYDHSGLSMSTGREYPFNSPWDAGQVGYIFVTKDQVRKEYSCKHITKKVLALAESCLRGEVETYNQYLTGDVYGYRLFRLDLSLFEEDEEFDPDNDDPEDYGEEIDSCYGFYGFDYCKEEVKSLIDYHLAEDQKEQEKLDLRLEMVSR